MSASGETLTLRLTWRQACTPSAGFASMVARVAVLRLLGISTWAHGAVYVILPAVAVTILWRRWAWWAQVSPTGLLVRRLRRSRPQALGAATPAARAGSPGRAGVAAAPAGQGRRPVADAAGAEGCRPGRGRGFPYRP